VHDVDVRSADPIGHAVSLARRYVNDPVSRVSLD
jgi:hypothetical protein